MKSAMKNRVFGLMLIENKMTNFNADWSGNPKMTNGVINVSPFTPKFLIKQYWEKRGIPVFSTKSFAPGMERVLTLGERFESLLGKKPGKFTQEEVVEELFKFQDIMCFGNVFAEEKRSVHATGAIQFGQGTNIFEDSEIVRNEMLSPYANSNKEEAKQSTVGSRSIIDEAHFMYDFSVDHNSYLKEQRAVPSLVGLTKEGYALFKEAALCAITDAQSVTRTGVENEMTLFVNCKENTLPSLGAMKTYVNFSKVDGKVVLDLTLVQKFLKKFAKSIDSVEIYLNEFSASVIWDQEIFPANIFSILDKEAIDESV